jgi:hypothetical protein
MSYTAKSTELINWIDRAIDRRKGGNERSKVIIATQMLISLAGALRSPYPSMPIDEYSYKIVWNARSLIKRIDPPLFDKFYQIVENKDSEKGAFNINGIEAIAVNYIFKAFTKTKARSLKSILKRINKDKPSHLNKYKVIESWCNELGLSVDLVRLDNADFDDLERYLKTIARDCETASINLLEPSPTA